MLRKVLGGNDMSRKNLRLAGYDYSAVGCYFVTMCVRDKRKLLWSNVGANYVRPDLSDIGKVIDGEIQHLHAVYSCVSVDKYVIMPNHLHFIISITDDVSGRTQFAPTIGRIVKQFKGVVTKKIGYSIWQKSYHDHIIRNETDYQRIWQYIDNNPASWQEDCYYV
ncbi:MAG: hypothetical protein FWC93_05090 [Defluviitaleaceae bacterium]|nr:hypothetical protein [Defluviitaleaceae bacterium]